MSELERKRCPVCGKDVPVLTPAGGNGLVFRKHYRLERVLGYRTFRYNGVPCEGSRGIATGRMTR